MRINGAELTDRDLLREMLIIFPYARQHNGFPKAEEPKIRMGALKMIEFEELVYQEAERREMTVPPATLQKAQSRIPCPVSQSGNVRRIFADGNARLETGLAQANPALPAGRPVPEGRS